MSKSQFMGKITLLLLFLITLPINAQEGYPIPPTNANRLFYIQHSNNHNTYVYDANIKAGRLDKENPVVVYRIIYTKGGIKRELTALQRKMAYGITFSTIDSTFCEFTLAAYPNKKLRLQLDKKGKPYVTVVVNKKRIAITKMFLVTSITGTNVKYIDFYGNDVLKDKNTVERFYPE
ncbi:DUF4833 domain-containing protein [Flavobacterium litorale]|uniref:DUF4833 domain-containing protein n=1 Tax=Flavobacterium litorale TaxID=2856519 RepID=A0ABX8V3I4_9FLAO|nr:DUF4833 domain-containing protein [Flavobacterium litorale]QYJ67409.1 DUF4833 domain-containing protein [Flavobacterium litorale]